MYNPVLETFIAVVKTGSFTKAAGSLFISSVSVMKQINNLENTLGLQLFNRSPRGVTLTAAGQVIYDAAIKMVDDAATAIDLAHNTARQDKKVIRIATSLLRSAQPILNAWESLGDKKGDFELQIIPFNDDPASLQTAVSGLGTSSDLIVGPVNANYLMNNDYAFFNLGDRQCNIMVPRDSDLANKKILTWDDLNGQSMILLRPHLSPQSDELRAEIVTHHPAIQIVNTDHFYDMSVFNRAANNKYLIKSLDIWHDVHPALIDIPMKWNYTISYGILYASNVSAHVREFISLVGQQYLKLHRQGSV